MSFARLAQRGLVVATPAVSYSLTVFREKEMTTFSNRLAQRTASNTTTRRSLSATAPTTPTTSTPPTGFVAWYESHLKANPIPTKMVTGSLLWGLGDTVAQVVPTLSSTQDSLPYDWPRTGRAALFGLALHAPASHVHFNFLEWMTQKLALQGYSIPVFKTVMEQFVYWSWVSNSMYHGTMGLMQGQTLQQCYDRIVDVLWETQKAQWVFWIPIQLLNFQFVPVRHQLNVVLLTSIVWTALLSAWYPPQVGGEKKEAGCGNPDCPCGPTCQCTDCTCTSKRS